MISSFSLQLGVLSFLIGIFCADVWREYSVLSGVFIIILLGIWHFKSNVVPIMFASFGFLLGCVFLFFRIPEPQNLPLYELAKNEETVVLQGIICSFPLQKEKKIELELCVQTIGETPIAEQKIKISQFGIHSWQYGQSVKVSGKLQAPKPFNGFAYDRFMAKDNIFAIMPNAKISNAEKPFLLNSWQQFWQKLFIIRTQFEWQVRNTLAFPESEYALGIVLGNEAGIPEEILNEFNVSGLRHLLALSGFNITIILTIVFSLFWFIPPFWRIIISLLMLFIFVGITGGSASVIRAAVMGGVGLIAMHSGRSQHALWVLGMSLFFISLWNPFLLLSDPSMQLSVLAVLGLIIYLPIFQRYFSALKTILPAFLAEVFLATLSAQVFTIPYMAYSFHTFSWVAPFANIFVVPITSIAMLFAFLCAIPYVGIVAMPFAYVLLHFSLWIAHIFASIAYAQISIPNFSAWHLLWIYALLIWGSVQLGKMK